MITDNSELLRRYLGEKSEAAFAELVQRNIDLVYSAALRQVNGDAAVAQDVTRLSSQTWREKRLPLPVIVR